jgi:glycosyltransferase involved in cell wall biosynthesis
MFPNKPEISLVMPTYNVPLNFLEESFESVISQSLHPSFFELVVVDDGSTDDTPKNLERITKSMSNVSLIKRNENLGQSVTRNQAIKETKGDYVALLDGDDFLEMDSMATLHDFLVKNRGVEYFYSQHRRVDEFGNHISDRPGYEFSRDGLTHFNFVGHLKGFSKRLHEQIGGFNEKILYAQDWDHVLRASEILPESSIKQIPHALYNYRVHSGAISTNLEKIEQRKTMACEMIAGSLKRKEGINADVRFSHKTDDLYTYYDWSVKNGKI